MTDGSEMPGLRKIVQSVTPPVLYGAARRLARLRARPEWEAIPEGWSYARTHPEVRGWNVKEVADAYQRKWERFADLVKGTGPLGIAHESDLSSTEDLTAHNNIMSFAYCLQVAANGKESLSMLDWGGGTGHYYLFAKALLPSLRIEYVCKDVSDVAQRGASILPEQVFVSDDTCLERKYDFVLASASFQYAEDWRSLLAKLGRSARRVLYIASLPTVIDASSFVFVQRPYTYGYNTEYLAWCLNQSDLINAATDSGMELVRSFVNSHAPTIHKAPEQCLYRGYLFRPAVWVSDSQREHK